MLSVLIIAHELYGFTDISNAGLYFYHLSHFLKDSGYNVSILYVGEKNIKSFFNGNKLLYENIDIISLPKWHGLNFGRNAPHLYKAFRIYRWVKENNFNTVFFNETHGYGYYIAEAKRQGYSFENTILVGTIFSPLELQWDIRNENISDINSYLSAHLEQKSIELSDCVITFSQNLLDSVKENNWNVQDKSYILPPLYTNTHISHSNKRQGIKEIIFIGDTTTENGYDTFIKAIQYCYDLAPSLIKNYKITVISNVTADLRSTHKKRIQINQLRIHSIEDMISYTHKNSCLNVIVSKSSTINYYHIALLYNHSLCTGQNNDIIAHLASSPNELFIDSKNPIDLAYKIIHLLQEQHIAKPVELHSSITHTVNVWQQFLNTIHQDRLNSEKRKSLLSQSPLVSVCLSHYNRPDQLREALISLEQQDYKNFEVLIMDDGSSEASCAIMKETVEPIVQKNNWKLFYQSNQYMNAARNNLVPHANGEYLMFMDDDNIALPDEISRFIAIQHKTKADVVLSNFLISNKNKYEPDMLSLTLGDALLPSLFGQNYFGDTNIFIAKDTFIKLGGWADIYGFSFTDQVLPLCALLNDLKIVVSVEPTFIYNLVGENHIGFSDREIVAYQYRIICKYYAKFLSKKLRNLPFLTYSLASDLQKISIDNISVKSLIQDRIKKKIYKVKHSIFNIFRS